MPEGAALVPDAGASLPPPEHRSLPSDWSRCERAVERDYETHCGRQFEVVSSWTLAEPGESHRQQSTLRLRTAFRRDRGPEVPSLCWEVASDSPFSRPNQSLAWPPSYI